jgi:SAM-dependent methyltransferase
MHPQHEANRMMWNYWARFHERSPFYAVDRFRKGDLSLQPLERELLGDVKGKSLLHLQCHIGLDTLSWGRLGADVTGVDISDESIELARRLADECGSTARFIRSDVYDLPQVLSETFDIVFSSYGVLPWLSDLGAWARVVAQFLKTGARFYLIDGHPFSYVFSASEDARGFEDLRVGRSYFDREQITYEAERSYAMREDQSHPKTRGFEWNHTLGDVVNALAAAGLRLERLDEHVHSAYARFFFQADDGTGRFVDPQGRVPLLFSLVASKS